MWHFFGVISAGNGLGETVDNVFGDDELWRLNHLDVYCIFRLWEFFGQGRVGDRIFHLLEFCELGQGSFNQI
jgi:hypothetical protein